MSKTESFLALLLIHLLIFFPLDGVNVDSIEKCNVSLKDCSCYDLGTLVGIECGNASLISTALNGFNEEFGSNTYEIYVRGYPKIPPRFLEGLIVYKMIIDDKITSEVSVDAFEDVNRLRVFHVFKSSIKDIRNFSKVPHSLRRVNIWNSLLPEVKGEFRNLPFLVALSLCGNEITTVAADAFEGTKSIQTLILSYNRITSLPESLLDGLANLTKIDLSYNRFHTVHGLLRSVKPKYISLEHNNLTDADDIFRPYMTSIESVDLSYNPLGRLSPQSFNGKISKVRFLFLNSCNLTEFRFEYFKNLTVLSSLDLSDNNIRRVGNESMTFQNYITIDLSNNAMDSFTGNMSFNTKRLYVSDNRLEHLGTILQYTQMVDIDFSRNWLVSLRVEDFKAVHGTENIAFRGNVIESIDTNCFTQFRNDIQTLDLSSNRLRNLNGSVKYMSQLKSLNISHNYLDHFGESEFVGLNDLSELYVQFNRIVVLRGELKNIPELQYLIIQHNNIRTLYSKEMPKKLQFLYLKGNSLNCDCRMKPFLDWLFSTDGPSTDTYVCPVADTMSSEYEASAECPPSCSCRCVQDTDSDFYMNMDCHSRHLTTVPSLLTNSFVWSASSTYDIVVQANYQNFSLSDRVLSMDLSNNSLQTVRDAKFPSRLKALYLDNNLLSKPPYSVVYLPKIRNLSLGENPWLCDCDKGRIVNFRNWVLSKGDSIVDVNNTRCRSSHENPEVSNKLLISLKDSDLCPNDNILYLTLAFSILSILFVCAALKITYSRFEMNIKVWLYAHGVSWVKEKDIDRDKIFDAFISFSHQDHTFVTHEIIEVIENRIPDIRLCIHYRNFIAGEYIHDNIINAVSNSKKTVLLLSKNFLESEWCLIEFREAHLQAMKDRVHRVIMVKVGELPEEMLDASIKAYLDTTTYITWGEKYFWDKLLYSLPTPGVYGSTSTIL